MDLSFNREKIELATRSGKRTFYLEEHTNEEFDVYLEESSIVLDRAIARLREISDSLSDGNKPDPEELNFLKAAVAETSSALVAKLLHPADEPAALPPVDAKWVRANLSWRMRESIINKQNELDGVETVKDQSFLVETALIKNYYSIKLELNRLNLASQAIRSRLTSDSESSQVLETDNQEQQEYVSIDELETDVDGFARV